MSARHSRGTLAWTALMLAGAATALPAPLVAAPEAQPPAAALQRTVASKLRLVRLLLAQSPAVQRIPHSGSIQARQQLGQAQEQFALAEREFNAGRVPEALPALDAALRLLVAASAQAPDVQREALMARRRNGDLREALRTVQLLHQKLGRASAPGADPALIEGALAEAAALAEAGKLGQANDRLGLAYQAASAALGTMPAGLTLIYDHRFDSPAEEFRYELARHRGYEELMPLALGQPGVAPASAALAEREVQHSRTMRSSAQQQAAARAWPGALRSIEEATARLQGALRILGVAIPPSTESRP